MSRTANSYVANQSVLDSRMFLCYDCKKNLTTIFVECSLVKSFLKRDIIYKFVSLYFLFFAPKYDLELANASLSSYKTFSIVVLCS